MSKIKQNVIYIFHRILFGLTRERNSDTCYSMDDPEDIMKSEISQSHTHTQIDKHYLISLIQGA